MSDIDRIEVVRGPGTATWGANAVQVIINIITKSAKDTQGIVATSEYGDATDRDQETVRYGGAFGNDGYYRIYGMSTDLSDGLNANGSRSRDAYINRTGGFRMDEGSEAGGKIQLSGNLYQNVQNTTTETESVSPPYIGSANTSFPDTGGDLMGHWEKLQSNGSTLSAEADYDSSIHYFVPYVKVGSNVQNIDLQDSLAVAGSQSIIFGAGYRNENIIGNAVDLLGTPRYEKNESTYSAFVQDQITISSKISAQIGSKFEHENFTGWEYEPSAHIGYSPDEQHTLWLSASRAVRIPTIADLGATMNAGVMALPGGTLLTEFFTQGHVKDSVIVAAYEAGYRAQVTKNVLFDLSTYYNQYSQLIGVPGYGTPAPYAGPPAGLAVYSAPTELGSGRTYGGEAVSHIRLSPDCRVNLGYSYLNGVVPASIFDSELNAPHSQFEVQAYDNLSKTLELDTAAYFVEAIPQIPVGSYTKLDVRLAYKVNRNCDLSVGGNNLLQNHYSQFGSTVGVATYEAEREFYSTVSWKL
jgi:iron complex outermembrane receptor protein